MAPAVALPAQVRSDVRQKAQNAILDRKARFIRLGKDIHAHPELAFGEEYASARIAELLADEGFAVRSGAYGLPTAFVATTGNGPLHVARCAE